MSAWVTSRATIPAYVVPSGFCCTTPLTVVDQLIEGPEAAEGWL
jgi:hypothetical protein